MMAVGDLIEFKQGFRAPWRPGYIERMAAHAITVLAALGKRERVTLQLGGKNRRGKVREVSGARCVGLVERIEGGAAIDGAFSASATAGVLPPVRIAHLGGSLRSIPRQSPPARCPAYLACVREQPCAGCGAAPPSEAHHEGTRGVGQRCSDFLTVPLCRSCHRVRTDLGALPDRTLVESQQVMAMAQVPILAKWAERLTADAGRLVTVPILRLVAACLVLWAAGVAHV